MMQIVTPRQWIKGELEKLIELTKRPNLSDEERLVLLQARLIKFHADIENPMMYKQDLK